MNKFALLVAAVALMLGACNRGPVTETTQFTGLENKPYVLLVNNQTGATLRPTPNTRIRIAPNTFTDSLGTPINGEVKLEFREFLSATDMLLNNIPMTCFDSATNSTQNFETEGSFEINGTYNGEQVHISANTPITIEMGVRDTASDYGFYKLNKDGWALAGNASPIENPLKVRLKKSLDSALLSKPKAKAKNKGLYVFDYQHALDEYFFRETYPFIYSDKAKKMFDQKSKEFGLQYVDYQLDWQLSYRYCDCQDYHAVLPWVTYTYKKLSGSFAKPQPDGITVIDTLSDKKFKVTYHIPCKKGDEGYWPNKKLKKYFKPIAQAVVLQQQTLNDYYGTINKTYKAELAAHKRRIKYLDSLYKSEMEMVRTFQVNNFGMYNWDRYYKEDVKQLLQANFVLPDTCKLDDDYKLVAVYFIDAKNKALVTLYKNDWKRIPLDTIGGGQFVAILPGNRIAMAKRNLVKLSKTGDEPTTIVLGDVVAIKNKEDLVGAVL